jgi:uncharacterized protein (TIGR02145 family)
MNATAPWILGLSFSLMTSCMHTAPKEQNIEASVEERTDYTEIVFGNQIWMGQNLDVSKFRNGETIPFAETYYDWDLACDKKQPVWCYIQNESSNGPRFGKLYNWYAVSDPRGLAPTGWEIPTDLDWSILSDFLKGPMGTGDQMKEKGFWSNADHANPIQENSFAALPGGCRIYNGPIDEIGSDANWWTSTESNDDKVWTRAIYNSNEALFRNEDDKKNGYSVRCIKKQ